jgi:hypothetical protein
MNFLDRDYDGPISSRAASKFARAAATSNPFDPFDSISYFTANVPLRGPICAVHFLLNRLNHPRKLRP